MNEFINNLNKTSFFLFKKRRWDYLLIALPLLSTICFVIIGCIPIVGTSFKISIINQETLGTDTGIIIYDQINVSISFFDINLSHYLFLAALLVLITILFSRYSIRKTGIVFVVLSLRTSWELLYFFSRFKFEATSLWNIYMFMGGGYEFILKCNLLFYVLLMLSFLFLFSVGFLSLLLPNKMFRENSSKVIQRRTRKSYFFDNLIIMIPITIFVVGEGNFFFIYPLRNIFFSNPLFGRVIYLAISIFTSIVLLGIMKSLKEPSQNRNFAWFRYKTFYLLLINIVWFTLLALYGITLWDHYRRITIVGLQLLYFSVTTLIISYSFYYFISFRKWKDGSKFKQLLAVNFRFKQLFKSKHFKRIIKICSLTIFFITLGFPLIFTGYYNSLSYVFPNNCNPEDAFGMNMYMNRTIEVLESKLLSNGSIEFKIILRYFQKNLMNEYVSVITILNSLIADTNMDSLFDSIFYFHKISVIDGNDSGNYSISENERDKLHLYEDGIYEFEAFLNQTFIVDEQINFVLAFDAISTDILVLSEIYMVVIS